MYFYLVKTFRDVPLKLKASAKDTDLENLAKTSGTTILAQIVEDLKKRKPWLLPLTGPVW
jgi:hypothetical protein